jgi:hypothetical protein
MSESFRKRQLKIFDNLHIVCVARFCEDGRVAVGEKTAGTSHEYVFTFVIIPR